MIFIVVVINIMLKRLFQTSGALLTGAMSIVSPAKFICGERSDIKDCKTKTWKYLLSYCAFNMVLMYVVFVVFMLIDHPFYDMCHKEEHAIGKSLFAPKLTFFLLLSLSLTILHWKLSLKQLFMSDSKHPQFEDLITRKSTFPETFRLQPEAFAMSGFFYSTRVEENEILCCYDCGLDITECHWNLMRHYALNDINIMHAANLLRHKAQYNSFVLDANLKEKTVTKEALYDIYAKSMCVKPECMALKKFNINFTNIDHRRKSFCGDEQRFTYNKNYTLEDLIEAGFVRTSKTSITCFCCLLTVNWSQRQTRFLQSNIISPWSLHAEFSSSSGSEKCTHLKEYLRDIEHRKLTFPKEFHSQKNVAREGITYLDYAEAGLYCSIWIADQRKAIVKCYEECGAIIEVYAGVRSMVSQNTHSPVKYP